MPCYAWWRHCNVKAGIYNITVFVLQPGESSTQVHSLENLTLGDNPTKHASGLGYQASSHGA